ncbi:hypothetical protein HN587_01795 [Candidatus Woesearchaeota archaeon]|jgi:hypothetical protein|nr:hypothetical protein [Candidatus Woesearchaeota archaeon]
MVNTPIDKSEQILLFICGNEEKHKYFQKCEEKLKLNNAQRKSLFQKKTKTNYEKKLLNDFKKLFKTFSHPYLTPANIITSSLKIPGTTVHKLLNDLEQKKLVFKQEKLWGIKRDAQTLIKLTDRFYKKKLMPKLIQTDYIKGLVFGLTTEPVTEFDKKRKINTRFEKVLENNFGHLLSQEKQLGELYIPSVIDKNKNLLMKNPLAIIKLGLQIKKEDIEEITKYITTLFFNKEINEVKCKELAFFSFLLYYLIKHLDLPEINKKETQNIIHTLKKEIKKAINQ